MIRKLAVEFLGTAILVYVACGVATLMFGFKFAGTSVAAGVVATALAFGLTLLALVYFIGPVSGSHVNPAVTIGALLTGRIPLIEAVGYWIAQLAGGIVGALVLWGTFSASPLYSRTVTGLGADGYGRLSMIRIGVGGAFAIEVILTAIFVFIVLRVTSATANAATAAIAIGLTLTVVHLIGIPVTGTSVNPARSLGPALVVGGTALSQVWLFIVAPLGEVCSPPDCTGCSTPRKTSSWPPRHASLTRQVTRPRHRYAASARRVMQGGGRRGNWRWRPGGCRGSRRPSGLLRAAPLQAA